MYRHCALARFKRTRSNSAIHVPFPFPFYISACAESVPVQLINLEHITMDPAFRSGLIDGGIDAAVKLIKPKIFT